MENAVETHQNLELTEDLLKEVFSLSSASTDYEVELAYDSKSQDFWKNEKLDEVYKSNQPKREYALDSLRGVLVWLERNGYKLLKEGQEVDLSKALNELVVKSDEE